MPEKITVIIADGHNMVREALKILLQQHPTIEIIDDVRTSQELLNVLRSKQPQVVVLDLEISFLNGMKTLSEIRKKFPFIKVVTLSSHHCEDILKNCMAKGANAYIPKECGLESLIEAILTVTNSNYYLRPEVYNSLFPDRRKLFSEKEMQIIKLLCKGVTVKEIAAITDTSINTVNTHRKRIYEKAGVDCLASLMIFVWMRKILSIHEIAPIEESFYRF